MAPDTAAAIDPDGLTDVQVAAKQKTFGLNIVADVSPSFVLSVWRMFWAPVPWMLEAAIALELALGDIVEAAVIFGLLVFNAALGVAQEGRAHATLAALQSRLALTACVRRNGHWVSRPASDLVPGDLVKLSLGGIVAADVRLSAGEVLLDQSMLTGESVPIEAGPGLQTYEGSLIRRGQATAIVTATGSRSKFGRTARLVQTARAPSSQQTAVLHVVRNLAAVNGVAVLVLIACAISFGLPWAEIVPLILTALLASIPVALPATFTLASALGARALASCGVLLTRLSAAEEAATMSVLCADKTGTLTRNTLTVAHVVPMQGFSDADVLGMAAMASEEGGADPIDGAIRAAAQTRIGTRQLVFVPFDPASKMSEATIIDAAGKTQRVVKGALSVVTRLAAPSPIATEKANELEAQGYRVLAVAVGSANALTVTGLLALTDPPRADAAALIAALRGLGVRTVMVTGDAPGTAASVAREVGLDGRICPPGPIPRRSQVYDVFAGVLPADKYALVRALQAEGRTIGMCGDGANDAPALRQAQIGIAVASATDIAKSASGMVLTEPGLGGVVAAVKEGRVIFQRVQTYTLNSIIKKTVSVLFLIVGLLMTGGAILTPFLIVLTMISGDFLSMALTTDKARASAVPNSWRIGRLTAAGSVIGFCLLAFCSGVVAIGHFEFALPIGTLRTLAFVTLVFGSQATIYAIRDHRHLWCSRPGVWLIAASCADIAIAAALAGYGIGMAPLSPTLLACVLAASIAVALVLDVVRSAVFAGLRII